MDGICVVLNWNDFQRALTSLPLEVHSFIIIGLIGASEEQTGRKQDSLSKGWHTSTPTRTSGVPGKVVESASPRESPYGF